MEGALNGFAQIQQMDMQVATTLNSLGRSIAPITALVAAIGLSSGKIFFKWVKRVKSGSLTLNKETISLLNNDLANSGDGNVNNLWQSRALCLSIKEDCTQASCGRGVGALYGIVLVCLPLNRNKLRL